MMDFAITIEDPDVLAGITWAREQFSSYATDVEYVQFVMVSAFESYAHQKLKAEGMAKVESDIAALAAKIEAARGK